MKLTRMKIVKNTTNIVAERNIGLNGFVDGRMFASEKLTAPRIPPYPMINCSFKDILFPRKRFKIVVKPNTLTNLNVIANKQLHNIKPVCHSNVSLKGTIPRYTKMVVSANEAMVFTAYLTVV